jgi:hypothetical protein
MRREARVRFLGGGGAAMRCCYPTKADEATVPSSLYRADHRPYVALHSAT